MPLVLSPYKLRFGTLVPVSVLYLPVHSPGVWCIAIGATPVMDPWMHERHCVAGIGTSIKICEIGLL